MSYYHGLLTVIKYSYGLSLAYKIAIEFNVWLIFEVITLLKSGAMQLALKLQFQEDLRFSKRYCK